MSQNIVLEPIPELILLDLDNMEELEYDYDSEKEFIHDLILKEEDFNY